MLPIVRRTVAVAASAVALVMVGSSTALADSAATAATLTAVCPGGTTVVMPLPGQSQFPPGFVQGTQQVFIPYKYDYSVGAVVTLLKSRHRGFQGSATKPGPVPAEAVTCSFTSFTDQGQTFEATGSVTGVIRGSA